MTREELITFGERFLKMTKDSERGIAYEFMEEALKLFKQEEPVLDKIKAEIQKLRNCSCSCSDGIIDDVEDIIDKYSTRQEASNDLSTGSESEDKK